MNTEDHYHRVNGITIHTVEAGDKEGDPIVFLHGFPEFWYGWKNQLAFFAEKGYRVIIPDQRGYNLSSKPAGVKSYCLHNLCNDVVALIHHLTDKKVVLVGHDWGGVVAWRFSLDHPQLIHHLVVINMPHPQVFSHTVKTDPVQMLSSSYAAFFQLPYLPEWISRAFGLAAFCRTLVKTSNKHTFSRQDLAAYKKAWQQPGAITAMLNWYRAHKYNKLPTSGLVEVPVLLIWGKHDQFLLSKMAQQSIDKCANGKLEMIDAATHWVHHEYPQYVNALIHYFVTKQG
jgi:pimeloyl-ACP methyl ester carboxylesterase